MSVKPLIVLETNCKPLYGKIDIGKTHVTKDREQSFCNILS